MVKVKVCGNREPTNAAEVAAIAPDYMGFIFYTDSPRFVGVNAPNNLFAHPGVKSVGVFVNSSAREIESAVTRYGLDCVQLHGDESVSSCIEIRERVPNVEVWKAFAVDRRFEMDRTIEFAKVCQHLLFDTKSELRGGSGERFNWEILKQYRGECSFILAGGIGEGEIDELCELERQAVPIHAIDLNSRVESTPGIKNISAVKRIIEKVQRCSK